MKQNQADYFLSGLISVTLALTLLVINTSLCHWFVIPVVFCGVLIGRDAVSWLKGRFDLFDPIGVLGVIGWHFFFLAPLMHVYWNYWMGGVVPPADWRPWLGYMAILNLLGLVIYQMMVRREYCLPWFRRAVSTEKTLDIKRFKVVLALALFLSFFLQLLAWQRMGGVFGILELSSLQKEEILKGMGIIFTFSESFPILLAMGAVVWFQRRRRKASWAMLIGFLLIFFVVQFVWGGLRGSRSATVWKLFWVTGMVHLALRPVPRRIVLPGLLILILFMYVYGFYKTAGAEAVDIMQDGGIAAAEETTGRTSRGLMLGDLGRSDVQAMLLHNSVKSYSIYDYALGETYLGGLSILIPRQIWPDRPPTKVRAGTDMLYGFGAWESGLRTSRVFGLAGEAIINFGFLFVPLAFSVLGLVVSTIRYVYLRIRTHDPRILLVPFLINLCVVFLIGDSDEVVFFIVKNGFLPASVILLSLKTLKNGPANNVKGDVLHESPVCL